jgi:CrcB protein
VLDLIDLMDLIDPLLVAIGAAAGAVCRYLFGVRFVSGTFAVNVAGSFLVGLLAGGGASGRAYALVGAGFCGALTTFSTLAYEVVELARRDRATAAVGYTLASVVAGLLAVAAGWAIGTATA